MGRSSRTTYSYNYEPDKVKVAEINKEKEILLAKMQQNNIDKNKQAELELMQANANFQLDIMKAKEEGFTNVVAALTNMMKEWNIINEQRIAFMNNTKFDTAQKISNLYSELSTKIDNDAMDFHLHTVPEMLAQLEKVKEPDSHEIYKKNIDKFISNFVDEKTDMLKSYRYQQEMLLQSSLNSIDAITNEVTQTVMNRVESLTKAIQNDEDFQQLPDAENKLNEIENGVNDSKMISNDTKQ